MPTEKGQSGHVEPCHVPPPRLNKQMPLWQPLGFGVSVAEQRISRAQPTVTFVKKGGCLLGPCAGVSLDLVSAFILPGLLGPRPPTRWPDLALTPPLPTGVFTLGKEADAKSQGFPPRRGSVVPEQQSLAVLAGPPPGIRVAFCPPLP